MSARETAVATPPERFIDWVRSLECVGCIRIEARHFAAGSESATVVATFEIAEQPDGGERFDAPAIYRRLEEDAEQIGGVQRYQLLAFREGAKAPRENFKLRVDGGADGDAASSEPANAHGLVAQAHRHNEALMGMVMRGLGQAMMTLSEQNKFLSKQLEKADERRVEMWGVLDQLATHDKDREAQKHANRLREQQSEVLKDGIKLLLPGLMTKVGLGSAVAQDEGLARFVGSLTEEQQASIFGALTPDQMVALNALLETRIAKDKKAEKAQAEREATP